MLSFAENLFVLFIYLSIYLSIDSLLVALIKRLRSAEVGSSKDFEWRIAKDVEGCSLDFEGFRWFFEGFRKISEDFRRISNDF